MSMQIPSMGRVLHYVEDGEGYPAIVRASNIRGEPTRVDLTAFTGDGPIERAGIPQDEEGHADGTWHWPERV